jgi:tellurite resistance protein TehA-like permease
MRLVGQAPMVPRTGSTARLARRAMLATASAARPAWFTVTMATGIVSVALLQAGFDVVSAVLFVLTIAAFSVTAVANLLRAAVLPGDLVAELGDGRQAFAVFATVAALDVAGARIAAAGNGPVAAAFAAAALATWLSLACVIPLRLARDRLSSTDVSGSWYLCAVATQSLAIAAAFLRLRGMLPTALAFWAGTAAFLLGALLYAAVSTAVMARLRTVGLRPDEPTAPYWVAMGAASITAFAAVQLRTAGAGPATIGAGTFTVMAAASWAVATCLLPVLAFRSARRHLHQPAPLRYRADLWMIVFPAGMYAVASMQVGTAAGWPALRLIGRVAVWPATAAWALVFLAMAAAAWSGWAARRR